MKLRCRQEYPFQSSSSMFINIYVYKMSYHFISKKLYQSAMTQALRDISESRLFDFFKYNKFFHDLFMLELK